MRDDRIRQPVPRVSQPPLLLGVALLVFGLIGLAWMVLRGGGL